MKFLKKILNKSSKGSVLIILIGGMLAASIIGAGMIKTTAKSNVATMSVPMTNAYYLAEAGARYLGNKIKKAASRDDLLNIRTDMNNKVFILTNGDKFKIQIDEIPDPLTTDSPLFFTSKGIKQKTSIGEMVSSVRYQIKLASDFFPTGNGISFDQLVFAFADSRGNGYGNPALHLNNINTVIGDIGTNDGNIHINNITSSYQGNINTVSGNIHINNIRNFDGEEVTQEESKSIVMPTIPESGDEVNFNNIHYNNSAFTLSATTSRMSKIELNNSTFTIDSDEDVTIYVEGSVILSNTSLIIPDDINVSLYASGSVHFNNIPNINNLTILGTETCSHVHLNNIAYSQGENAFKGSVYAPNAEVVINNTWELYGAVFGNRVHINNVKRMTYDSNLRNGGAVETQSFTIVQYFESNDNQ